MCLRAIMNYQIALSLNNKNPRTKALVLELLAAVCLVRGGHEIILSAFDNFKEVGRIVLIRVHKCLPSLNRAIYLFTDSRTMEA
ncbi:hypothetical protein U0070_025189 [Myodes glareolus]|uniref:Uncharacterized protein n=1 Tax=Myodes glareolus TaxID=447135 RepID=A0AAW0JCJ1_MYOGA